MTTHATRVPAMQDRTQVRVEKIVEAGRRHYAEVGRDDFAISGVAELAGMKRAIVFRYFTRKMLLDEVMGDGAPEQRLNRISMHVASTLMDPNASKKSQRRALATILYIANGMK